MGIYRKNVLIQLLLFAAFLLLGLNVIINYYLASVAPWYNFVILGVSIILIIYVVIIYKKNDQKIIEITKKEYDEIRIALYAYFAVYILDIVLKGVESINQLVLSIVVSVVLALISVFGITLNVKLLNKGNR